MKIVSEAAPATVILTAGDKGTRSLGSTLTSEQILGTATLGMTSLQQTCDV